MVTNSTANYFGTLAAKKCVFVCNSLLTEARDFQPFNTVTLSAFIQLLLLEY